MKIAKLIGYALLLVGYCAMAMWIVIALATVR